MADWVIVVDDDVTNLKMAGTILSKNNMRVTALKSGQALLNFIAENDSPDLILLDINMPEMNGFDTLKELRKQEAGKDPIPVIFLTADEIAEKIKKYTEFDEIYFQKASPAIAVNCGPGTFGLLYKLK